MKIDIQHKLREFIKDESVEESGVVYLLIEIGRLIEQQGIEDQYESLVFYRNWVAHAVIDRQTPYVKKLKEKFEKISIIAAPTTGVFGFVSFIELKNEIIRFFTQQIGKDPLPSRAFLNSFKDALVQVIADIPVVFKLDGGDTITISFDKSEELNVEGPGGIKGSIKVLS